MPQVLIPDGGQTLDTSVFLSITTNGSVPVNGFVDIYDNGTYIGTATEVVATNSTQFTFLHSTVVGQHAYTSKLRYAGFVTTPSAEYAVEVINNLPVPTVTLNVPAPVIDGFTMACPVWATNGNEFVIEVGIPATAPSGIYAIVDGDYDPIPFGTSVSLTHVLGTPTYYTVNTAATDLNGAESSYAGNTWYLINTNTAELLHEADVPSCGSLY
jgi:hypothetical protein